jgi:hypothetical protein
MNKWLKIVLLLFQIGGGLLGIVLVGRVFLGGSMSAVEVIIYTAFAIVFGFGILAGVVLISKPGLGLKLSLIFQSIQIPIIITPVVSYILYTGGFLSVYRSETGWGADFAFLGSRFYFYLYRGEPWCVGVNIVALALFVVLVREIWFKEASMKISKSESSNIPDQPLLSANWRGR